MGGEPALAGLSFLCRIYKAAPVGWAAICHIPVDIIHLDMHRSRSDVFESPSTRSCIQPTRAFPSFFLSFFFFSRLRHPTDQPLECCPRVPPCLVALVLLLCMLLASVRGLSECFRALYILTQPAIHPYITPSLLQALAVMSSPSSPSTWALYIHLPLHASASRWKKSLQLQGRDQACLVVKARWLHHLPASFRPRSQDFGIHPRRSRGTRMSSRDESDPTSLSLH